MTTPTSATWSLRPAINDRARGCDCVRGWLRDHNRRTNPRFMELLERPEHERRPLTILAWSGEEVVGGIFADTQLKWLRIDLMAVAPERRNQGVGTGLLKAAEEEAVARGCQYAFVDTMDYQAPRFYLAHGFEVVGRVADWDSDGHEKLYFCKSLRARTSSEAS
ncbi:MAG TPA: GNAT family N-acetyltransferase [Pirellulales bacterium]